MSDDNTPTYRAFLLRCWRESPEVPGKEPIWHLSLTDVAGEQTEYEFASLSELVDFLRLVLMAGQSGPDPLDSPPEDVTEGPTIQ